MLPIYVINGSGIESHHFLLQSFFGFPLVIVFLVPIFFQQVVKFLVEKNSNNALHGQVTIGTLIFQVILIAKVITLVFLVECLQVLM